MAGLLDRPVELFGTRVVWFVGRLWKTFGPSLDTLFPGTQ
jgi:hypothetical protein